MKTEYPASTGKNHTKKAGPCCTPSNGRKWKKARHDDKKKVEGGVDWKNLLCLVAQPSQGPK